MLAAPGATPTAARPRQGAARAQRRHTQLRPRALGAGSFEEGASGSFDEGGLDRALARELGHRTWEDRRAGVTKHLELLYQASQSQSEVRARSRPPTGAAGAGGPAPGWGCLAALLPPPPAPAPCSAAPSPSAHASPHAAAAAAHQGGAVRVLPGQRRTRVRLVPRHRQAGAAGCEVAFACWCSTCSSLDALPALPSQLSAAAAAHLPCRRHDGRRRAVLQRGRLRAVPRVPRHGEGLRCRLASSTHGLLPLLPLLVAGCWPPVGQLTNPSSVGMPAQRSPACPTLPAPQGACKCEHCRGTGRRASWLPLAR